MKQIADDYYNIMVVVLIDYGMALKKGSSNHGLGSIMSIVAYEFGLTANYGLFSPFKMVNVIINR